MIDRRPLNIASRSRQFVQNTDGLRRITVNVFKEFSVENAFQAGKVFENGGPFLDLLTVTPREAKRDTRLKESGRLLKFKLIYLKIFLKYRLSK